MSNVISLVKKTESSKHWGPRDVLNEALKEIEEGKIGPNDRLIIVAVGPSGSGEFNTHFLQCGMSASEMITLLEIAKMDVYRNLMTPVVT